MSTRANIHFVYQDSIDQIVSNIYRHSDGYPTGLGADLHRFLDACSKLSDNRFDDPEYLAAKYLVWQANEYSDLSPQHNILDFISVAPCITDHDDIDYVYTVVCGSGRPKVYAKHASGDKVIEIKTIADVTDVEKQLNR